MVRCAILLSTVIAVFTLAPVSSGKVRLERRTFPGLPGAALAADIYRGTIDVNASQDGQFHLEIAVDPGTDDPAESERLLARVNTEIKQNGPAVSILVSNPSETSAHFEVDPSSPQVSIYCRFLVPPVCDLDLATIGAITVGDLTGRLKARSKNGTIFFRHIHGDVDAGDEKADIVLSHCDGSVRLKVLLGNLRVGTVVGRVEAEATNGDVEVQHVHGGGSISTIKGDVTIGVPKDLAGKIRIDTDYGDILVKIEPQAHCSINAKSVWGSVHLSSRLPLIVSSGGNGHKTVDGLLNGGGPMVELHADGGQVRIEPRGD